MTAPSARPTDTGEASKAYSLVAMPPQPFDKYTLIGKLGHGGMAEVNLAVADGRGGFRKLVVIKRLHRHLAMEPGFIEMFLDEARLAARLNHPHCVQTHEVGEFGDSHFLAMEYLDGQGLERLLRISGQKDEPVPVDVAARIVADALDGLAYAHELTDFDGTPLGVVHRDVSPQNIFVTYNGMVKLLDFGIAKAATHVVETRTGVIKGKYAYIAPEQALAQELDHRADLWSMGVVLWEVLTGRRLFKSVNELATLHETLQGEIKLPSAFRPDLPAELDTICMRALTRDAAERYQSAQDMKDDLERWMLTLPRAPSRKHIARLMRDRFAEVIEVHKSTLAQCLKGGAVDVSSATLDRMMSQGQGSSTPTPSQESSRPSFAAPVEVPRAERGGGGAWKLALVATIVLGAVGIALWLPQRADAPRSSEPVTATSQPAPVEPQEPAVHEPPAEPGVGTDEAVAETAPSATEAEPPPEPAETEPDEARAPAQRTARRGGRRPAPAREEPAREPAAPSVPPAPSAEASASSAPGFLTLATTPWTRVRLGSRELGTTPLIRVELPPGSHTLSLSNPEQGIEQTYRVTIHSGETVTRRLGLR